MKLTSCVKLQTSSTLNFPEELEQWKSLVSTFTDSCLRIPVKYFSFPPKSSQNFIVSLPSVNNTGSPLQRQKKTIEVSTFFRRIIIFDIKILYEFSWPYIRSYPLLGAYLVKDSEEESANIKCFPASFSCLLARFLHLAISLSGSLLTAMYTVHCTGQHQLVKKAADTSHQVGYWVRRLIQNLFFSYFYLQFYYLLTLNFLIILCFYIFFVCFIVILL